MSNLKRYREAANLTQFDLAVAAGLSPAGVAQIESGRRKRTRPRTKAAIAAVLGVPEDAIWPPEEPPAA